MEAHGVDTVVSSNWITFSGGFPAFRLRYEPGASECAGRAFCEVILAKGRVVETCFAAIGKTDEEAVQHAVDKIAQTLIHPVLAYRQHPAIDDYVGYEQWRCAKGDLLNVILGDMLLYCTDESASPLTLPADLEVGLEGVIAQREFGHPLNWLMLFTSQLREDPLQMCVEINNERWPEAEAALAQLAWPRTSGFWSGRLFMILHKQQQHPNNPK